jgi:outer membrane biosynthesis protein TonB
MMEPRPLIRSDIVASLVVHLSIVALLVLYSDVHPFGALPSETIAIDLVTPAEVESTPTPTPAPDRSEAPPPTAAPEQPPPPARSPSPSPQQRQASRAPKGPAKEPGKEPAKEFAKEPARQPAQPQAQPPPPTVTTSPGYAPPEPDITVKYQVMLGLPVGPSVPASAGDKPGDGVDASASTAANIDSSLIAEFRRHLRTCSKLPAEIAPSDKVIIKLRSLMAPDGTLAAEPILIEASASAKGPLLMQSAIGALQACQPYTMLPKDRYGEWKVIDLSFTPQDFAG